MDGTILGKKYDLMGGGGGGGASSADHVSYDNTVSQLTADNVQEAIDEVVGSIGTISGDISDVATVVGDSEGGLVKDVADIETTIGDSSSGLVKDVADLGSDVTDLQNANKYLTTETLVGKWGNANLYRKVVNIGALPNSTGVSYNIGLTTETVRRIEFYYDSDNEFGSIWTELGSVSYNKSTKKLDVSVTTNMSSYDGIVIIEYTK